MLHYYRRQSLILNRIHPRQHHFTHTIFLVDISPMIEQDLQNVLPSKCKVVPSMSSGFTSILATPISLTSAPFWSSKMTRSALPIWEAIVNALLPFMSALDATSRPQILMEAKSAALARIPRRGLMMMMLRHKAFYHSILVDFLPSLLDEGDYVNKGMLNKA